MKALRVVVRVGILWVVSLLVSVAGMAIGHRIVIATGGDDDMPAVTQPTTSAVSIGSDPAQQWR